MIINLKVNKNNTRLAIVTNRTRTNTTAFRDLELFLNKLNIPVLAQLRDTQNYNRFAKLGLGIHEYQHKATEVDRKHWQSIFNWIETNAKNRSILKTIQAQVNARAKPQVLRDVS